MPQFVVYSYSPQPTVQSTACSGSRRDTPGYIIDQMTSNEEVVAVTTQVDQVSYKDRSVLDVPAGSIGIETWYCFVQKPQLILLVSVVLGGISCHEFPMSEISAVLSAC